MCYGEGLEGIAGFRVLFSGGAIGAFDPSGYLTRLASDSLNVAFSKTRLARLESPCQVLQAFLNTAEPQTALMALYHTLHGLEEVIKGPVIVQGDSCDGFPDGARAVGSN